MYRGSSVNVVQVFLTTKAHWDERFQNVFFFQAPGGISKPLSCQFADSRFDLLIHVHTLGDCS